jgi:maltose alpha-D-glucosyltransferase/alpha-amylase
VKSLIRTGDTRWLERGAHDLMGWNPDTHQSASGMPRATSLYGTLPEQLSDPRSFASRLAGLLAVRESAGIATGTLLDVPDGSHAAMLVLVNRLADGTLQVTVLNFSEEELRGTVMSQALPAGSRVVDLTTDEEVAHVDELGSFRVSLGPFGGLALVVREDAGAQAD